MVFNKIDNKTFIQGLKQHLENCDMILIGAGSGLSTAAGFTYDGKRFETYFKDFIKKYQLTDMYSAGFYPYVSLEEYWAYWSRHIYYNRYVDALNNTYELLYQLMKDKDYFVLTTNVDHQFQKSGFDKQRLFYTQGDYGLWQCAKPCHQRTYDNESVVKNMITQQKHMKIPTSLIPRCPKCHEPMSMNLRCDQTFVQDEGWYAAQYRFEQFLKRCEDRYVVYLELGVGGNTPSIIKYPFWKLTSSNEKAIYVCINQNEIVCPKEIQQRSILIPADIHQVLQDILDEE